MHRLKHYLIIWFVCGVIGVIIDPVHGMRLRRANETGSQSIRTREYQYQQQQQQQKHQYHPSQYVFSKPANRTRGGGINELRKLPQKLYEQRQNDDPDQNSVHRSNNPIHIIQQKIKESEKVSAICVFVYKTPKKLQHQICFQIFMYMNKNIHLHKLFNYFSRKFSFSKQFFLE